MKLLRIKLKVFMRIHFTKNSLKSLLKDSLNFLANLLNLFGEFSESKCE